MLGDVTDTMGYEGHSAATSIHQERITGFKHITKVVKIHLWIQLV